MTGNISHDQPLRSASSMRPLLLQCLVFRFSVFSLNESELNTENCTRKTEHASAKRKQFSSESQGQPAQAALCLDHQGVLLSFILGQVGNREAQVRAGVVPRDADH